MKTPGEALSDINSALEYLHDRGELYDYMTPLTGTRYGGPTTIPHFDMVVSDRVVRFFAIDVGPHIHEWDDDGYCICGKTEGEEEDD